MTDYSESTFSDFVHRLNKSAINAARKIFADVKGEMQNYPPKRPDQKYVRTYTFMRAWKIKATPQYAEIKNYAEQKGVHYAGYVVGNTAGKKQAWMHAGRWQKFKKLIDERFAKIPENIRDLLRLELDYIE